MKIKAENKNTKKNKSKTKVIKKVEISKAMKIIIAIAASVLCIATVLSIVLISNSMHPIEKFAHKMMKKQNFQMEVSIYGIPIIGGTAFALEVDGKIIHVPDMAFTDECYIETVGDTQYTYTKDANGRWIKAKSEDSTVLDFLDKADLQELITPDNYDLVEGTENVYRQKADVQFEKFKDITITLEKESCKIEMIAYVEGMALETQIVISKIGQMNLKLPSVR